MLRDASPRDARSTRRNARKRSQLRAHPDIDRERLRRRDRAVVEQHVRYRVGDRRLRIEERAEGREFAIEQVVYEPVNLQLFGELVRAVQVRDPVVGELGVLVGVVANEPLATDPDDVGAEFQLRRDPVIDATFDLMPRIWSPGLTKIFPSASAKGLFGDASFPENW